MYVDFKELQNKIPFKSLLDNLNIPYAETDTELKTDRHIVNKQKNLFLFKGSRDGGNIINFTSKYHNTDLRSAALWLIKTFLTEAPAPKKGLPEYEHYYHPFLAEHGISEELAKDYEVGYIKKGIMNGNIGFKVYQGGEYVGYAGIKVKDNTPFYPKGFKAGDYVWNIDRVPAPYCFLCGYYLDALILISKGYPLTTALFTKNATDKQLEKLSKYKQIILFHSTGENIATRLSHQMFVKLIKKPVNELTAEELEKLF